MSRPSLCSDENGDDVDIVDMVLSHAIMLLASQKRSPWTLASSKQDYLYTPTFVCCAVRRAIEKCSFVKQLVSSGIGGVEVEFGISHPTYQSTTGNAARI